MLDLMLRRSISRLQRLSGLCLERTTSLKPLDGTHPKPTDILLMLVALAGCGTSDDAVPPPTDRLENLAVNDSSLRNDFNDTREHVRLVLIVSPG